MAADRKIDEFLNRILQKIVEDYAPKKIILFGSYASGTARPDSDLVLLIIKETSDRFIDRCFAVRRIISDPTRTIPVEPLVLTPSEVEARLARGDQFVEEILEKGQVLYAA